MWLLLACFLVLLLPSIVALPVHRPRVVVRTTVRTQMGLSASGAWRQNQERLKHIADLKKAIEHCDEREVYCRTTTKNALKAFLCFFHDSSEHEGIDKEIDDIIRIMIKQVLAEAEDLKAIIAELEAEDEAQ
jgi:hypothetical protein